MKRSKIFFILFIIAIITFSIINFTTYKKELNNTLNNATYAYNECKKLSDNDSNYKNFCEELVTQHEIYLECLNKPNDKNCSKFIKNYKIQNKNTEEIFYDLMRSDLMLLCPIFSLIIIVLASYEISHYTNNLVYKNYLLRMSYNNYIKTIYKKLLKYIIIMPLFVLINLLLTFTLTSTIDFKFLLSYKFIMLYMINLIIYSFIYINLTFICANGSKNFIVTFAKSFGLYVIIIYIMGSISIILKLFNININQINIFDLFNYSPTDNPIIIISSSIVLLMIITFILYLIIRNKEKVLINMEKNEVENDNQYK